MVREIEPQELEARAHRLASPTLIIGLGGTGAEVLSRVRDRFFSALGPLENYPVIRYLWLDTDTIQESHVSPWYKRFRRIAQQLKFQPAEKVELTVSNTEAYLSHLNEYQHIRRWVYPHLTGKVSINEGAGQQRAYGRLAFFHNVDEIRSRLDTAVRGLIRIDADRIALEHGLRTNPDTLNVIIVSSLAGGTGSGTFLDTAYLVRQLVGQLAGNRRVTLMGFLLLPAVFGGPDKMSRLYANGYAAMKELNHYNYSPPPERQSPLADAERSVEHDYTLWWAANEQPATTTVTPFDVCYLVDGMNEGGAAASGEPQNETIFNMVSEAIFQDFDISEFGTAKRSSRDNLLQWLRDDAKPLVATDDADLRLPKRYFSMGLATITFPVERVRRACAAKLAMDVVDYWLRPSDEEVGAQDYLERTFLNAINFVEVEAGPNRPTRREVLDALYATSGGRRLQSEIVQRVSDVVQDVKQRGTDRAGRSWGAILHDEIEKIDRDWNGERTPDPKEWGAYVARMRQNQAHFLRDLRERLDRQITALIHNEHRGIGFALAVLDALEAKLTREKDGYIDVWTQELKVGQTQMQQWRSQLGECMADLSHYWDMSNWHLLRSITLEKMLSRFEEAAANLYQARIQCLARQFAIEVAAELRAMIAKDLDTGWRHRLNHLQETLAKVRSHLEERVTAYAEANPDPRQILLYDGPEDLARIYGRYVKVPTAAAKEYNDRAQEALGVGLLDVYNYTLDIGAVCDRLMQATAPHFATIEEDYDAFTEFQRKYPPNSSQWSEKIDDMLRACHHWLAWERGYTGIRDTMDDQKGRFILGMALNNDERRVRFAQTVSDRFGGRAQKQIVNLNSRSQIVFYVEVAGFALCQTKPLAAMRGQYQKSIASGLRDLHTDREDARFADLVVLSKDERAAKEMAARAYLLGCILGVLRPVESRDGRGNRDIAYEYLEKQPGLSPEPRYLGNHNAVVSYLMTKMDTLLLKVTDDITWRRAEILRNPSGQTEYAAVLRLWIEKYYPSRKIDMGNGVTEPVRSIEQRMLKDEMSQVMKGTSRAFEEQVEHLYRMIGEGDGFTVEMLDKRRVLLAAGQGAAAGTWPAG
ncbi:MAG TPA: tubulin-like doman-containing protein [Symbiobacteriaceae bacterium]|nr:tubulin-like doman-containing protein [Symbiobacteriaceae bacterium]